MSDVRSRRSVASSTRRKQDAKLADLLEYNLKTVRSYLLKEEFQLFWEYDSPAWAAKSLDAWCKRAMRSRIEPSGCSRLCRPLSRPS